MTTATLNASETMRLLRITRTTLADLLASGELRGFVRGKVIRVSRQSVEELLGDRRRRGSGAAAELHHDERGGAE